MLIRVVARVDRARFRWVVVSPSDAPRSACASSIPDPLALIWARRDGAPVLSFW
jgi:hypothetical protein